MKKTMVFALVICMLIGFTGVARAESVNSVNEAFSVEQMDQIASSGIDQRSDYLKQNTQIKVVTNTAQNTRISGQKWVQKSEPRVATVLTQRKETQEEVEETYTTIAAIDYQGKQTESDSQSKQSMTVYVYITYDYKFEDGYANAFTRFNKTQHKMVVHSSALKATALRMEYNAWSRANLDENSDERRIPNPVSNRIYSFTAGPAADWWYINEAVYMASTSGYTSDGEVGFIELEITPGAADLQ